MAPRPSPPVARTAVADATWDHFVDRRGVATTLALLVVIVSLTFTAGQPDQLADSLAGPQLLLVLIVLGCMGVIAYRQHPD